MERNRIKNHFFNKMGDTFGQFIDSDHFMGRYSMGDSPVSKPSYNIRHLEGDKGYELSLALPGFKEKEIEILITEFQLQIKAISKQQDIESEEYLHMDFRPDRQERWFQLPFNADRDLIQASYSDGLLVIIVPYKEPVKKEYNRFVEVN